VFERSERSSALCRHLLKGDYHRNLRAGVFYEWKRAVALNSDAEFPPFYPIRKSVTGLRLSCWIKALIRIFPAYRG
jgi:hypothetical protein